MAAGCKEADYAIDIINGVGTASVSASSPMSPLKFLFARERDSSSSLVHEISKKYQRDESRIDLVQSMPVTGQEHKISVTPDNAQPDLPASTGTTEPIPQAVTILTISPQRLTFPRDPFMPPSEELIPTECPPSMPLCRFDYTQLKLRGLIKSKSSGGKEEYKGMVEDPEGRGYFITAGTQVRGATVTQVTSKGVVLYVHKTKKLDWLIMEGGRAKGS